MFANVPRLCVVAWNNNLNINTKTAIFYRCCYASGGGLKTRNYD